jgi:hypothetical protein
MTRLLSYVHGAADEPLLAKPSVRRWNALGGMGGPYRPDFVRSGHSVDWRELRDHADAFAAGLFALASGVAIGSVSGRSTAPNGPSPSSPPHARD